jgi:hypothetical protein
MQILEQRGQEFEQRMEQERREFEERQEHDRREFEERMAVRAELSEQSRHRILM